jgi:hypothetical protein
VKISLCHSTARLPVGWIEAHRTWLNRADAPAQIEYVLAVDHDRLLELEHPKGETIRDIDKANVKLAINRKRHSAVDGWNASARAATGDLLVTVSDDWFPPLHWDTQMRQVITNHVQHAGNGRGEYVLDVDNGDGAFPLLPFSILTRKYLERLIRDFGYEGFFYPEYWGMMADCEFTDLAREHGVVINARHMKFTHLNPDKHSDCANAGTTDWDATYLYQRRPEAINTGKQVYVRRVKELGIRRPGFIPLEFMADFKRSRPEAVCS